MKYLSVEEMIAIERAADRHGHSYAAMMEAAGKGLAEIVEARADSQREKTVLALVGSGNNGGDALVALDYLRKWGWKTTAALFRPREDKDPLLERFVAGGGKLLICCDPEQDLVQFKQGVQNAAILLDGVLGTGVRLPLREPIAGLLGLTNEIISGSKTKPMVIAVDCPSGIDCDSGEVSQVCIPADITVTMAAIKQGLLKFPAYDFVGELIVVEIGLPADLPALTTISREVNERNWVSGILPDRPRNAHKGTFGTSMIIAGSRSYPGAAALAGVSAYRSGAGLVIMAVPEVIYRGLVENFPEAVWVVLDDSEGGIAASGIHQIQADLKKSTACLIGPGLSLTDGVGGFLEGLLALQDLPPLVVDADGLRSLAALETWETKLPAGSVLTPHPGEMAALSGLSVAEIQADRVGIAEQLAHDLNQVILLKGAHTVIAGPDGRTRIQIGANPALARAGSGDVLAGIICGLIAQGVAPFDAAAAGAWVHYHAGETAVLKAGSPASVLAGEISASIGTVLAGL